jgi:acyl carrier protein
MEGIKTKVNLIVSEQLCIDQAKILPESNFTTQLGADSLDVVELVIALEEGFDIEITDEKATELETVQDAVNYIMSTTME